MHRGAHPSAHARTPQVMNAEFARRGVDAVAVSADVAPGDLGGFTHQQCCDDSFNPGVWAD